MEEYELQEKLDKDLSKAGVQWAAYESNWNEDEDGAIELCMMSAEIVRMLSGQVLKGAVLALVRELDRLLDEGER